MCTLLSSRVDNTCFLDLLVTSTQDFTCAKHGLIEYKSFRCVYLGWVNTCVIVSDQNVHFALRPAYVRWRCRWEELCKFFCVDLLKVATDLLNLKRFDDMWIVVTVYNCDFM